MPADGGRLVLLVEARRLDELDFGPKRGVEFVRTLTFAEIFERSIRPLSVGIAARDSLFAGNDDDERVLLVS